MFFKQMHVIMKAPGKGRRRSDMLVSIVIPCYNSEHSIEEVVSLTKEVFAGIPGKEPEFILVDDCSKDGTFAKITELAENDPSVHGISLMRNFGQHNALMCALNHASGELIIGMDDDLQCHPSQIPVLLDKIDEGYDIVYGIYRKQKNKPLKNFTHWLNKVTSRALLGRPKDIQSSNFWIITKMVRDEVIRFKDYNPNVDGLLFRTSRRIGNVPIEHHVRVYGSSNYTLAKLIRLWLTYFNYSLVPLRFATVLGMICSLTGFLAAVVIVIKKLISPMQTVGWASLMSALFLFSGVILLVLGILGEYIGKIILSINNTPQYIIRSKINLE